MLTVKAEAAQRMPLPFASPKDTPADDMFTEMLRRLRDDAEPAAEPRPEKAERSPSKRRNEPKPSTEPERRTESAGAAETAQPSGSQAAGSSVADSNVAEAGATQTGDIDGSLAPEMPGGGPTMPVDSAEQLVATTGQATTTGQRAAPQPPAAPVDPLAGTAASPPTSENAAVPAATASPLPAADAPPAPSTEAPTPAIGDEGAPPVQAEAAAAPIEASSKAVPPEPARSARAAPAVPAAQAGPPAAAPTDMEPSYDSGLSAPTDGAGDDVVVRVERTPRSALAQGLGKLGSGAEVALAAQAIGDAMQSTAPGQLRKNASPQASAPAADVLSKTVQDGAPAPLQGAMASVPAGVVAAAASAGATAAPSDSTFAAEAAFSEQPPEILGGPAAPGLRTAGAAHAHAMAAPRASAVTSPAEQVAVQVQRAISDGASRITVQLKPAELGSIEVKLDFAQDGRVSASILADRPETLDLLQRDARLLERSLQDAGLKTDSGSLSFDLRGGGRQDQGSPQTAARAAPDNPAAEPHLAAASETTHPAMTTAADGGVDIRV